MKPLSLHCSLLLITQVIKNSADLILMVHFRQNHTALITSAGAKLWKPSRKLFFFFFKSRLHGNSHMIMCRDAAVFPCQSCDSETMFQKRAVDASDLLRAASTHAGSAERFLPWRSIITPPPHLAHHQQQQRQRQHRH